MRQKALVLYISTLLVLTSPATRSGTLPDSADAETDHGTTTTLDRINVHGQRIRAYADGNMDLPRHQDDAQPYQILERQQIEQSGATTVEDFLRQQLTSSTAFSSSDVSPGGFDGSSSKISLRGLGANQTLVLVNGRRVAGVGNRGNAEGSAQPDLNGIPLAAIDRIEVLPASASAIYGSGALGGVINVVLRRDYRGADINLRYESTDDGEAPIRTVNATKGFQFADGRTQLLLSAQDQKTDALYAHERELLQRGRARQLHYNPDALLVPAGSAGNPPAGALVNIRSADGSALFGPGSSFFTHIPLGYRGWRLDGLQPLIDNQGTYNLDLARDALGGYTGEAYLIGQTRTKSTHLSLSHRGSDRLELFFDAGWSETQQNAADTYYSTRVALLSAKSPNNPFGKDVRITYPVRNSDRESTPKSLSTIRATRAALGFSYQLRNDWRIVGDYAWSHSYNDYTYRRQFGTPSLPQAINAGIVDILRDTTSFPTLIDPYSNLPHTTTDVWQADSTLRGSGRLASWYAGEILLATGVEHRALRSAGFPDYTTPRPAPTYRRQQIDSLYAEATVPLASPLQGIRGLYSADLQLALRHERFDVESSGASFNATVPTFGLRYQPIEDLIMRASFGKGFLAPTYSQLAEPVLGTVPVSVNDPRRGGELNGNVFTRGGGNPLLDPETSRNFNLGMVYQPEFLPGLRLSADYFRIQKRNNITSLGAQAILDNEAIYGDRVIRAPATPGSAHGVGEVLEINTSAMNMLKMETAGLDVSACYQFDAGAYGDFDLGLNATFTDYYRLQSVHNSPLVDWVGVPSYNASTPIDTRIGASLVWRRDRWTAGWSGQYYDGYHINPGSTSAIRSQGGITVSSQLYHDVFVRLRSPDAGNHAGRGRAFNGFELTFGVKNLFDKAPPVDMSTSYTYSTLGDPRMRRLYVNLKKLF